MTMPSFVNLPAGEPGAYRPATVLAAMPMSTGTLADLSFRYYIVTAIDPDAPLARATYIVTETSRAQDSAPWFTDGRIYRFLRLGDALAFMQLHLINTHGVPVTYRETADVIAGFRRGDLVEYIADHLGQGAAVFREYTEGGMDNSESAMIRPVYIPGDGGMGGTVLVPAADLARIPPALVTAARRWLANHPGYPMADGHSMTMLEDAEVLRAVTMYYPGGWAQFRSAGTSIPAGSAADPNFPMTPRTRP